MRLHCGCVAVPVNWFVDIISSFFAKFKNAVHRLEPGETPSNSGVSPGSQLCAMFLNIAKYFKTLRCGCGAVAFIFSIYLKPVLYFDFRVNMLKMQTWNAHTFHSLLCQQTWMALLKCKGVHQRQGNLKINRHTVRRFKDKEISEQFTMKWVL